MTTPEQIQAMREVLDTVLDSTTMLNVSDDDLRRMAEAYERAALSAIYIPTDEPEHNGIVDAMRYITPPQEASNE